MEVDYSKATTTTEGDWIYVQDFYDDGVLKFSEQYQNNEFEGEQKYFREDGSLQCHRVFKRNNLLSEEQFEGGEKVRWKKWDERGKQIERFGYEILRRCEFDFRNS